MATTGAALAGAVGGVAEAGGVTTAGELAFPADDGALGVAPVVLAADVWTEVALAEAALVAADALTFDVIGEQPATAIQTPSPTADSPNADVIPLDRAKFIVIPVRLARHGHI